LLVPDLTQPNFVPLTSWLTAIKEASDLVVEDHLFRLSRTGDAMFELEDLGKLPEPPTAAERVTARFLAHWVPVTVGVGAAFPARTWLPYTASGVRRYDLAPEPMLDDEYELLVAAGAPSEPESCRCMGQSGLSPCLNTIDDRNPLVDGICASCRAAHPQYAGA
jgi:hypothetical protein